MNTYVNFAIAKLLKQKGFNELCAGLYIDGELETELREKVNYHKTMSSRYYIAPTIAEVVIWVHEKHGIWIGVKPSCDGSEWYSEMFTANKEVWDDEDKRHQVITASRNYKSIHSKPTEAYEAAIEYCLTNFIS